MSYPLPLPYVTRELSPNVLLVATPFRLEKVAPVGARMVLFKFGAEVVVWLPIPWGPEFKEILDKFAPGLQVTFVIIANTHHCVAGHTLREPFPQVKFIAPEGSQLKNGVEIDYIVPTTLGDRVLTASEFGVSDDVIGKNFEFIYMTNHLCKELVVYHDATKTIYVGDMLFNLGDLPLEQFSQTLGVPLGGWLMGYWMSPKTYGGKITTNFFNGTWTRNSAAYTGLRAVLSFDFNRVVMCHGNDLEGPDVKKQVLAVFD